jgi:hypothetical protein
MIDPDQMNPIAVEGFKLLYESGVLRAQQVAEFERLVAGNKDADPQVLTQSILEYRQRAGMLESLHLFGEELVNKETEQ